MGVGGGARSPSTWRASPSMLRAAWFNPVLSCSPWARTYDRRSLWSFSQTGSNNSCSLDIPETSHCSAASTQARSDMFRFNFIGGEQDAPSPTLGPTAPGDERLGEQTAFRASEEIGVSSADASSSGRLDSFVSFDSFRVSDACSIRRAANPVVDADAHAQASTSESDLVPGRYEGGYKVWECSVDLSRYIASSSDIAALFASGTRVIELGCGQGLVGITALALGAGEVHFQDYDASVIRDLTVPVVSENVRLLGSRAVRYFAGDWGTLAPDVLGPRRLVGSYDVVLTSESIYNEEASVRLLDCIKCCLKPGTGVCYLAAKSFYFGVGGGVAGFQAAVDRDGTLRHRVLRVIDDGKSNRREILELRYNG